MAVCNSLWRLEFPFGIFQCAWLMSPLAEIPSRFCNCTFPSSQNAGRILILLLLRSTPWGKCNLPGEEDRIAYSTAAQGQARTLGLHTLYLSFRGTDEPRVTGQEAIPQHPKACSEDVPTHTSLPDGLAAQDSKLGFWPSA